MLDPITRPSLFCRQLHSTVVFVFGIMDHMGVLLAAANANRDADAVVATQQFKHRHREWDAVRKAKKRKTHDGFTDRAHVVALMIYDFCNYASGPAARWLKLQYKQAAALYSLEELGRLVEDWFIIAPMALINGLSADPDSAQRQHQYDEARRVLREQQAVSYIGDVNWRLGVAPSTRDVAEVLDNLAGNGPDHPMHDPARSRVDIGVRRNRLYMQRFRRRWTLKHGKIAARTAMTEVAVTQTALSPAFWGMGQWVFQQPQRCLPSAVLPWGGVGPRLAGT